MFELSGAGMAEVDTLVLLGRASGITLKKERYSMAAWAGNDNAQLTVP